MSGTTDEPVPRTRPTWLVPALAALVAVLVGVAVTLVLLREDGDDEQPAPLRTPTPGATPSATSGSPTAAPTAAGRTVDVRGIVLTLPDGWSVGEEGDATVCLGRSPGTCELYVVDVDAAREASQGAYELPNPDSERGWYTGTDVPACEGQDIVPSRRVGRELREVGDRKADYAAWEVECADGTLPERPRLWWLPRSRLAFFDESDDPAATAEIDEIVRTADVSAVAVPR